LTIIAYAGAVIVEQIARSSDRRLGRTPKERTIERLRDHFIICGYGRVAGACREFRAAKVRTSWSISRRRRSPPRRSTDDLVIVGDATEDEDLKRAGIDRAAGVVVASTATPTISTSPCRPATCGAISRSSARASDEDAEKKLLLAGADRVVLPYTAAGRTMANLVLKPQVMSFLDAVTTAAGPDLHMAEIEVHPTCATDPRSACVSASR